MPAAPAKPPTAPGPPLDYTAALLSYLVPGLGQLTQRRFGKGALFLVCLLGLFFFGMYLGGWRNVYLETIETQPGKPAKVGPGDWALLNVRFFGQFPIGIAAWPAIIQYNSTPSEPNPPDHPVLGKFERRPSETELNDLLRNSDKMPDLGWTYTVIAGMLNLLVIYDALAGPAFAAARQRSPAPEPPGPPPEDRTVLYLQLVPLIVVISLVYSATRHEDWPSIFREAFRWGYRMLGFLLLIAVVLFGVAWLPVAWVAIIAVVLLVGGLAGYVGLHFWGKRFHHPTT